MLQLFGQPFSSYTWKALIPLYDRVLPFTFRVLGPEQPENKAVVQERTPAGKIPVLLDDEKGVFEATGIIKYLGATRPECRTLLPADPRGRRAHAHAQLRVRQLDDGEHVPAGAGASRGSHVTRPGGEPRASVSQPVPARRAEFGSRLKHEGNCA